MADNYLAARAAAQWALTAEELKAVDIEIYSDYRGTRPERRFVSFDDLRHLNLLAGSGIVRPERDPDGGGALVSIRAAIFG